MADSTHTPSSSSSSPPTNRKPKPTFTFLFVFILPVALGVLVYQLDSFDPASYPPHELTHREPMIVPKVNGHMLKGAEKIGNEELLGPEDIAYDHKSGVIYTGCDDGWIQRVKLNESAVDSVVQKWVNTGGRPLGLVHGHHGEVIIADAFKGLLNATSNNTIQLLTDEADGLKFKLTDAVDIAKDGILYFTDATYKYNYGEDFLDLLEGRPNGRLLSFNPSTKETKMLVKDLYFANGVALSPDNQFVIVCETPMRRCKRYYLRGEREKNVDIFIENLPGLPDNIMYDGEGLYWIALFSVSYNTFVHYITLAYGIRIAIFYDFIINIIAIDARYVRENVYDNVVSYPPLRKRERFNSYISAWVAQLLPRSYSPLKDSDAGYVREDVHDNVVSYQPLRKSKRFNGYIPAWVAQLLPRSYGALKDSDAHYVRENVHDNVVSYSPLRKSKRFNGYIPVWVAQFLPR